MGKSSAVLLLLLLLAGCSCTSTTSCCDADSINMKVQERVGGELNLSCDRNIVPQEFTVAQPLTEDHAVLLALWNNPTFQDALVDLKLTRADLIAAGQLPNPEVVYFFSVPEKPFKYAVDFPIEALWLRPIRTQAASVENLRACERLTQLALDLIRDTRQAYADLVLARERVRVAEEAVKLRTHVAELAEARFKAGDTSRQDLATAKIEALQAKQDATRIGVEVPLAEEKLKNLMGLTQITAPIPVLARTVTFAGPMDVEALAKEASQSRPDIVAAELAVQAADERVRLSHTGWFRFLGILDATSGKNTGHEFGPAIRATLPIFHWNQGAIARAEAEREQLECRRNALRNLIITEVRQSAARYQQTSTELNTLRKTVQPEVEAAIKRSEKAYQDGNASYLIVLETTRQLIDTYNRDAQLVAERQRAWAELERSVGRHLETHTASTSR